MPDLTEIDGVGDNTADRLQEVGIENVEDVLEAGPDELTEAKGVGPSRAQELQKAAVDVVDESETDDVIASHYNPITTEYDNDMGYYCEHCGKGPWNSESTRDTHENRCDG